MIFSLMFTKMFEQAYNTAVTDSHGQQGSCSEADQILGRYLIDPAEIGRLERDGECGSSSAPILL